MDVEICLRHSVFQVTKVSCSFYLTFRRCLIYTKALLEDWWTKRWTEWQSRTGRRNRGGKNVGGGMIGTSGIGTTWTRLAQDRRKWKVMKSHEETNLQQWKDTSLREVRSFLKTQCCCIMWVSEIRSLPPLVWVWPLHTRALRHMQTVSGQIGSVREIALILVKLTLAISNGKITT